MKPGRIILATTGAVVIAGTLIAVLDAVSGKSTAAGLLPYGDPEITAQGAAIYSEHCASCHAATLEGQPNWRTPDSEGYLPAPPHDESGHTWHHPDTQLFEITKYGTEAIVGGNYRSRMIGFGDILKDSQIIAVLAWIKSTWPQHVIDRHDQINAERGS